MKTMTTSQPLPFPAQPGQFPFGHVATCGLRLVKWLGVDQVTLRSWPGRLPSVLTASIFLTVFLWLGGFRVEELRIALAIALVGMALASPN